MDDALTLRKEKSRKGRGFKSHPVHHILIIRITSTGYTAGKNFNEENKPIVEMDFHYTVKTERSAQDTIQKITDELAVIKFGVLGILDFKSIFEKKGMDFPNEYKLLEICNPSAAKMAIESDPNIGLLLPCTIAVYEKNGNNYISLARPTSLLSIIENPELEKMGKEIEENIIKIIEKIK